jgi:hypothetical protein
MGPGQLLRSFRDDNRRGSEVANKHRGEISVELDGRERTLCLTLGALAELEASFGLDDLVALAGRLGSGKLSALEIAKIIGEQITDAEVGLMRVDGGAAGFARIAAGLIRATFGTEGAEDREMQNPQSSPAAERTGAS